MKSEHRHDLKTNDLAKSLLTTQDYVKLYGGRVFLGLAIVVLIIVLIIQRSSRSQAEAAKLRDDLAYADSQIDRLSRAQVVGDGQVTVRPAEVDQVRRLLQEIREKASDKKTLADAAAAQGDYSWALANYPDVPGAASQPSLRPDKPRPELLKDAKDAYQQVLSQYPDQHMSVIKAHFGLAAIAEDESNWDEAKKQYEAVANSSDASTTYQNLAKGKLIRLEEIRQPILVGTVPEKAETIKRVPLPSTTTPSTNTSTHPATPATKAAVTPATKSAGATKPAKYAAASQTRSRPPVIFQLPISIAMKDGNPIRRQMVNGS
jgi:tetratricopeptide (TPR) repeat protein